MKLPQKKVGLREEMAPLNRGKRLRIVLGPSAARNSRLYNPITKYSCQKLAVRYVCDLKQLEMEEEIPLDQLLNILPPEPSSN